jgi:hypothetical protein
MLAFQVSALALSAAVQLVDEVTPRARDTGARPGEVAIEIPPVLDGLEQQSPLAVGPHRQPLSRVEIEPPAQGGRDHELSLGAQEHVAGV